MDLLRAEGRKEAVRLMVEGLGVAFVFPRVLGSVEALAQISAGMPLFIGERRIERGGGESVTLLPGASWHIVSGHTNGCTTPDWPLRQRWRLHRRPSISSVTDPTDQPLMLWSSICAHESVYAVSTSSCAVDGKEKLYLDCPPGRAPCRTRGTRGTHRCSGQHLM